MKYFATINNKEYEVEIKRNDHGYQGTINGKTYHIDHHFFSEPGFHSFLINHRPFEASMQMSAEEIMIYLGQQLHSVHLEDDKTHRLKKVGVATNVDSGKHTIKAPMPGLITKILINEGDAIKKGDSLLIIEAMKMENEIKAPHAGIVTTIYVLENQAVDQGVSLITLD